MNTTDLQYLGSFLSLTTWFVMCLMMRDLGHAIIRARRTPPPFDSYDIGWAERVAR
jgi:hypothetical protein